MRAQNKAGPSMWDLRRLAKRAGASSHSATIGHLRYLVLVSKTQRVPRFTTGDSLRKARTSMADPLDTTKFA